VSEHRGIDALENVLADIAALTELAEVGVIDQPGTKSLGFQERSLESEVRDDRIDHGNKKLLQDFKHYSSSDLLCHTFCLTAVQRSGSCFV
jgi:hypothetical protein